MVHLVFILSFTLVTAWGVVLKFLESSCGDQTPRCPEPEVLVRAADPAEEAAPQDTRTMLGLGDGGGAVCRTRVCQARWPGWQARLSSVVQHALLSCSLHFLAPHSFCLKSLWVPSELSLGGVWVLSV